MYSTVQGLWLSNSDVFLDVTKFDRKCYVSNLELIFSKNILKTQQTDRQLYQRTYAFKQSPELKILFGYKGHFYLFLQILHFSGTTT